MDFVLAGRMVGAFAVIMAVLFALQFIARANLRERLSGRSEGRLITVLETTILPNAAALHVVKIGERYVVIGRSGGHIATLSEIPERTIDAWLEAQSGAGGARVPFGDFLARMRRRRSGTS